MLKKLPLRNNKATLLVIQSTSFCNISCSYCYLENKDKFSKMSPTVFEATLDNLIKSEIDLKNLSIVFHAGEPLAVGVEYYEIFWAIAKKKLKNNFKFCFQTNGTLIDTQWVKFFKDINAHIGVSIDGPAEIHDKNRRLKNGKGSFNKVLDGVSFLQKNDIPFYTISVLTDQTFLQNVKLIEFLVSLGPKSICFNIDEIEGPNKTTSVTYDQVKDFYSDLIKYSKEYPKINFREIKTLNARLKRLNENKEGTYLGIQNTPLAIITVDTEGNFSTTSPELIGSKSEKYNNFIFGNVQKDLVRNVYLNEVFDRYFSDLMNGVEKCKRECILFEICGGGAPANKYFENGTLVSTRTKYCDLTLRAILESVAMPMN